MSREPRFRHVETFCRTGRTVARIRDTIAGRDMWIHRQGKTLLHWDLGNGGDRLVENGLLRFAARSALEDYASQQRAKLGRPCVRCSDPFKPKPGSNAKTCGNCISEISRANGLKAHIGEAA